MEAVGFEDRIARADVAVTGEGSFDEQSLHGKVPDGVIRAAAVAEVPVAVVCGRATVHPAGVMVRSLVERVGPDRALDDPVRSVELVAEEVASQVALGVAR